MGKMYFERDKDGEGIETHLELYKSLLEPKWSISQAQFLFYLKKVKEELDSAKQRIDTENIGRGIIDRWSKLDQLEREKVERMATVETITQKMAPLIVTEKIDIEDSSGTFFHLHQKPICF